MESKQIDLNQSVHTLCTQYPELIEILAACGFRDITNPAMLMSAGRFMTIPKGAALKKLDLNEIIQMLTEKGLSVSGQEENQ